MVPHDEIREALNRDLTIDITTTGCRTGRTRRTEIWFHRAGERYIITGTPGRRDWYANLLAHPRFTFHLKESVKADLPARAVPITDPEAKRRILLQAETIWNRPVPPRTSSKLARAPQVDRPGSTPPKSPTDITTKGAASVLPSHANTASMTIDGTTSRTPRPLR